MEENNLSHRPTRRESSECARRRRIRDFNRLTALLLAVVILVLTLVNLLVPDREFSENENRMLTVFPKPSWSDISDGSYMSSLSSYMTDQFVGRDNWISFKLTLDKLLGKREANGVYLGKEDYLIGIPSEPDWEHVDRNLQAINAFAQSHSDLSIHMSIVPNAACVLSGFLPQNAPVRDQRADLAALQSKLDSSVAFIDVTEDLTAHASEGLYYRTDHHWTTLGAYYAFLSMADSLQISDPLLNYNKYTVSDSFSGTLASKSGCHAVQDSIEVFEPLGTDVQYYVIYSDTHEKSASLYQSAYLKEKDQYAVFLGGNHPMVTIRTTNNNNRSLLVIKDSYANSLIPFLVPYYEEIILVDPRYYYDSVESIISSELITDVLFLYNLDTFLGDTSLADVLVQ